MIYVVSIEIFCCFSSLSFHILDAVDTCGNYFSNPFPCEYFPESDCVAMPTTTMTPTTTTPKPGMYCTRYKGTSISKMRNESNKVTFVLV